MITIKSTTFSSNQSLAAILSVMTKDKMLEICKKLDLYVSPNLKKDETARRVAETLLSNPISILSQLNKQELLIVDEFVKGGPDTYVIRKMRKTQYKLQKYALVLTHEDEASGLWHLLMPDCVRESLSTSYHFYLDCALKGLKVPSAKQLRMMSVLNNFLSLQDEE